MGKNSIVVNKIMISDLLNLAFGAGIGFTLGKSLLFYFNRNPNGEDTSLSEDEEEQQIDYDFEVEEDYSYDEDVITGATCEISPEDTCGVFLVRKDLKMGRGKEAAQCGHAILGLFHNISHGDHKVCSYYYDVNFPKLFFYVENEEQMDDYRAMALGNNLCACKIRDAGRTQIAAGSATVLGIGPVPKSEVSSLFGSLTPIK